jgi:hypothetical protein
LLRGRVFTTVKHDEESAAYVCPDFGGHPVTDGDGLLV